MKNLYFTLPATTDAARRARHQVDRHFVGDLGPAARQRLSLALSEIVSNVVRHGDLSDDDEISIAAEKVDQVVRISVEQPTPAPARVRGADAERHGGLGLRLVDASVDRWGVDEGPPGRVWFEIPL